MAEMKSTSSHCGLDNGPVHAVPGLFCSPDERLIWDHHVAEAIHASYDRVASGGVAPSLAGDIFRERLAEFTFEEPRPLADNIAWAMEQMEQGLVHVTHQRYFGLFNPAPSLPAELADRITAAFNPQLATSKTSPVAIEVEKHVIRAFAKRAGFPREAGGHFATGGSEANCTALLCALIKANPNFVEDGVRTFGGAPVFYVSDDAHLAWYKIAVQCGIGHAAVRLIATEADGRMDINVLSAAIRADKGNGHIPVMIVATAGTTSAGMVDPLHACATIAVRYGLWYHVDAAWGGGAIASPTLRCDLDGIELADSITIDAHKWFATTMACSMFITRHTEILQTGFFVATDFMPSLVRDMDPYMTTVQWSRRFLGLRLFLSLATVGWQGHGEYVERSVELARLLKTTLRASGWRVLNESNLAVICAVPPDGYLPVREIAQSVVSSGRAWISCTKFKGREVLRMCTVNGRTSSEDITMLVRLLESVGVQAPVESVG